MKQAEQQSNQQIEAMKQQGLQEGRDFELQKIQLENEGAREVKLIEQETQLLVWEQRLKVDTDGNGYANENETYGASLAKNQQAQESLNLNRAKFEFDKQKHKDNLALKQQQKTK